MWNYLEDAFKKKKKPRRGIRQSSLFDLVLVTVILNFVIYAGKYESLLKYFLVSDFLGTKSVYIILLNLCLEVTVKSIFLTTSL